MPQPTRVLVVDDDPTITDVVSRYLVKQGYAVRTAGTGPAALELLEREAADLVVLDIMLPGLDGLEVARRLRATSDVPIILLTALGEPDDRIAGLELGADDYVTKPFSPRELVLRVQAVLRRWEAGTTSAPGAAQTSVLRDGGLVLDPTAHEVHLDGELLNLTLREFDLLAHLMSRPREVRSREELIRDVWGWSFGDESTVTVHVRRLRDKLGEDDAEHPRIVTVRGVGYRYEPAP